MPLASQHNVHRKGEMGETLEVTVIEASEFAAPPHSPYLLLKFGAQEKRSVPQAPDLASDPDLVVWNQSFTFLVPPLNVGAGRDERQLQVFLRDDKDTPYVQTTGSGAIRIATLRSRADQDLCLPLKSVFDGKSIAAKVWLHIKALVVGDSASCMTVSPRKTASAADLPPSCRPLTNNLGGPVKVTTRPRRVPPPAVSAPVVREYYLTDDAAVPTGDGPDTSVEVIVKPRAVPEKVVSESVVVRAVPRPSPSPRVYQQQPRVVTRTTVKSSAAAATSGTYRKPRPAKRASTRLPTTKRSSPVMARVIGHVPAHRGYSPVTARVIGHIPDHRGNSPVTARVIGHIPDHHSSYDFDGIFGPPSQYYRSSSSASTTPREGVAGASTATVTGFPRTSTMMTQVYPTYRYTSWALDEPSTTTTAEGVTTTTTPTATSGATPEASAAVAVETSATTTTITTTVSSAEALAKEWGYTLPSAWTNQELLSASATPMPLPLPLPSPARTYYYPPTGGSLRRQEPAYYSTVYEPRPMVVCSPGDSLRYGSRRGFGLGLGSSGAQTFIPATASQLGAPPRMYQPGYYTRLRAVSLPLVAKDGPQSPASTRVPHCAGCAKAMEAAQKLSPQTSAAVASSQPSAIGPL